MAGPLPAVNPPKLVAVATDKYLTPTNPFADPYLPVGNVPKYGQDFTFGTGRAAPQGHDVGKTEADLKPKMEKLLGEFAASDKSGMAKRLFAQFLAKQSAVIYFEDNALNTAAVNHPNIKFFLSAAMNAPGYVNYNPAKHRVHQALKAAGWDVTKITAPTDLGVPAFNTGSPSWHSGDFANGLGVMINGVQYVYVTAVGYQYDKAAGKYSMTLRYRFYDVFGLDDDDLAEYGSKSDGWFSSTAGVGITAWWQLQHQHGYAPLVTKIVCEATFKDVAAA